MEKLLFSLITLVLVSYSSGQAPSCRDYPCPKYDVQEQNKDFEVRHYADTDWITTKLSKRDSGSLMAAAKTLGDFCDAQKKAGHDIIDGWPALITIEDGEDSSTSLSWFLAPGSKPEVTDTSVTLEHKAEATVYVRKYDGTPSLQTALENKKILQEALVAAGKKFKEDISVGAVYERYFSLTHHNEIWLYSA
ncbi:heme-binding protein 2-like [Cyprinodon tularosa]|uniref:heme-binding protein 2-like n=1 Tax=Cyprinodon tularosa TaxID=77115 RepID=UPI0018E26FFA|nr:heme-binding protein 2-like [Cyprinodon tularosa]